MQAVMAELMRTNKTLPLQRKLIMNHDKSSSKLPVIQALRTLSKVHEPNMNAQGFGELEGAVRFIFFDQLIDDLIHILHPRILMYVMLFNSCRCLNRAWV
ncbi:hypothetical protein D3C75_1073680 [compost metagenome]